MVDVYVARTRADEFLVRRRLKAGLRAFGGRALATIIDSEIIDLAEKNIALLDRDSNGVMLNGITDDATWYGIWIFGLTSDNIWKALILELCRELHRRGQGTVPIQWKVQGNTTLRDGIKNHFQGSIIQKRGMEYHQQTGDEVLSFLDSGFLAVSQ